MIPSSFVQPDLLDVVEILLDLPDLGLQSGDRGAIVEKYDDRTTPLSYEIEFTNADGETIALSRLSAQQFIVIWRNATQTWVSLVDRIAALIQALPEDRQEQVLSFTRTLYQPFLAPDRPRYAQLNPPRTP